MDIKDLNKSQLLLLAVLLSFITSIATGITTVTLMQQAPSSITTPVSRIVKQTIERIEQVEGKTTVKTVVIKEEDLIVEAIAENRPAVFSVTKEVQDLEGKTIEVSAGRGFAISQNGVVVVDGGMVDDKGVYYLSNDSGKYKTGFVGSGKEGFALVRIGTPVGSEEEAAINVPTFGDVESMRVGQKIVILGKDIQFSVFEGAKNLSLNISKSNAGAMVFNLDGDVLGMALSGTGQSFVSISTINSALKSIENPEPAPKDQ